MKQVIYNLEQLSGLSKQLDMLFQEANVATSLRWPLIELWFSNHSEIEPVAVLVWRDNVLVATALLSCKHYFCFYVITKAGVSGEPYMMAAIDAEAGNLLADAVYETLEAMDKPWLMWLTDMPLADIAAIRLIEKLKHKKVHDYIQSPHIWFESESNLNQYLSKNTRSAIAKAKNKITKDNLDIAILWLSNTSDIESCLGEIIAVHRERNRVKRGHAVLDDQREEQFFRKTVLAYAQLNKIKTLVIRLNGSLAAFSICVVDRETLWVYSNMVSPNWTSYSAGTIANAEVVKYAHSDPAIKAVNWGAGLQRYKLSGNSVIVPSMCITAWSSLYSRLFWRMVHLLKKLNFMSSYIGFSFIKSINLIQDLEFIELIL